MLSLTLSLSSHSFIFASAFLTDPTDNNPTFVVDSSNDHHDPQSSPNPNLNLHNNHPFPFSPLEHAPPAPHSPPFLFHFCFNQDHACFAVGTDHEFWIYNCDPFRELFRRDFDNDGGVGVVEAQILGLSLDCREGSGQLRRRSLGCLSNDGATMTVSIRSNISRYYR